jgi:hypothetical protein
MRLPVAALSALALAGCAIGPAAGDIDDWQSISAGSIGGGLKPADIRIYNRHVILFTAHWNAITPDGAHYRCHRDDVDEGCKLEKPARPKP